MQKKTVKRCVRPQCMQIYEATEQNRFCLCGAALQTVEIEIEKKTKKKAFVYLRMEDEAEDVQFKLSDYTRIGRAADGVRADIDLSAYVGKVVSREHAVIRKEKDGYYITNVSANHSVRIIDQDGKQIALENGGRALLKSEDGILLSRKVLLQFVEEG